jgi:carboxylate-amine ligase
VRGDYGIDVALPELNGAQRQRRLIDAGATMEEVYAATVRETRETYAQEVIA